MSQQIGYLLSVVLVGWTITFALRALPFMVFSGFRGEVPKGVERFGNFIAPVIIGALIVYSYSGLAWRTPWPYLAGALTVGLQLWFRNGLVSILAGTVLYMLLVAGCKSYGPLELDARHPEVRITSSGVFFGEQAVAAEDIPDILESYEVPHDRTIHILYEGELSDLHGKAREVMSRLAKSGYRRPVLVTPRHGDSASPYTMGEPVQFQPQKQRPRR